VPVSVPYCYFFLACCVECIFDCLYWCGFHNVTSEAVNVSVRCSTLSTTHCSEDCLMWKAKLYAMY